MISRLREKGQLRPFAAIELKETRGFKIDVLRKDVKKLGKLLSRKNRFKYGFVIYVCLDEILVGLSGIDWRFLPLCEMFMIIFLKASRVG